MVNVFINTLYAMHVYNTNNVHLIVGYRNCASLMDWKLMLHDWKRQAEASVHVVVHFDNILVWWWCSALYIKVVPCFQVSSMRVTGRSSYICCCSRFIHCFISNFKILNIILYSFLCPGLTVEFDFISQICVQIMYVYK